MQHTRERSGETSGVSPEATPDVLLNAFARLTSAATLLLIFAGGLVTSTGSGLAVPDWPLSYGQFFPPMVGGVFYEHGHRMIAGTVAILTVVLALWVCLTERRSWVRRLALVAVAAVLLQAVLGGLTVLFLLPTAISVTHACLGQTFFCVTVILAMATGRTWNALERPRRPLGTGMSSLRALSVVLAVMVYAQLIVGAVMRHTGAGLAIPDFPLAFGRIVPDLSSPSVTVHYLHRIGALAITAVAAWTAAVAWRDHGDEALLVRPAVGMAALVALQVTLGALTIWTAKAVLPATAHVATGAAILATAVVLAVRCSRMLVTAESAVREMRPSGDAWRATA
jgi:cytochrome c oxidase assembly protein subunit 15